MPTTTDYKPLAHKLIDDVYNNKTNYASNIATYVADNINEWLAEALAAPSA